MSLATLRHHRTYYYIDAGGGDVTAPVLSNPAGSPNGPFEAIGVVDTDEGNGTLHWVVTESPTTPSVAQIQAGQDHLGAAAVDSGGEAVASSGQQSVGASGLTPETTYYFHFQHRDAASNDSTAVSSAETVTSTVTVSDGSISRRIRMGYH